MATTDTVTPSAPAPRRTVAAWSLWDFGSNAFNTVMWSFVFSVYVTSTAVAPDAETGVVVWTRMQTAASLLLLLLAPMMGAWADSVSNRRRMLTVSTLVVVAAMAGGWFVEPRPDSIRFLLLGTGLLALASLVQEIATIFYNGMLVQISTPRTIGRISGTAWALGYVGGVICLVLVLVLLVMGGPHDTGLLGLPSDGAVHLRAIAPFCAAFLLVFSVPVMIWGPAPQADVVTKPFTVWGAYRDIARRLVGMWRAERGLLHFLVASAIYRDGLAAVFGLAGVFAASAYGFSQVEVIVFGIAANVVAGLGTWVMGRADDAWGPRPVIVAAIVVMVVAGLAIIITQSTLVFWVGGMLIASMVGAVQSASRTLLVRITPPSEENETFGLYATVGRMASPIAPFLVSVATAWWGVNYGMVGIIMTLAAGLVLFWFLRIPGVTHDRVTAPAA